MVGFTLNDIQQMHQAGPAQLVKPSHGKSRWVLRLQKFGGRLYAGRLLREASYRLRLALRSAIQKEQYHTRWMRSVCEYWSNDRNRVRLSELVGRFDQLLRARQIPYLFVLFPDRNDVLHPGEFATARKAAIEMLRSQSIAWCDPYDAFATHPNIDDLYLPQDSVHFTPAGHKLVHAAISKAIDDVLNSATRRTNPDTGPTGTSILPAVATRSPGAGEREPTIHSTGLQLPTSE